MTAYIDDLLTMLEQSENLYHQMLPVIQREKQAALSAQSDQLTSASEEKEELLAQLQQLERRRQILIHQIADDRHLPAEQIKLSTLADSSDQHQAVRMRRLSVSLNELVPKIKKANEENRAIIQHCLSIVHGALGFFQHFVIPTDVYGASGQMSMQSKGGNLISGAI